jgi:hypothetical protein
MKLIHHGGYNEQERESYKEIIYSNTIQSMRAILDALPQLDLALSPQNDARRSVIMSLPAQIESDVLPSDVADAIRSLWRDSSVKEAVRRSREFQLNDSAVYYFNAIDRMASVGYMPTDQDILRSRVKTTGITETTFKVGELTYKLFDVGGQRSERKKWIHCFENVTALVFLVSLSEYDQMLYEDENVVRLSRCPIYLIAWCSRLSPFRTACRRHSLSSTRFVTQDGLSRRRLSAVLFISNTYELTISCHRFCSLTRSTCSRKSSHARLLATISLTTMVVMITTLRAITSSTALYL